MALVRVAKIADSGRSKYVWDVKYDRGSKLTYYSATKDDQAAANVKSPRRNVLAMTEVMARLLSAMRLASPPRDPDSPRRAPQMMVFLAHPSQARRLEVRRAALKVTTIFR